MPARTLLLLGILYGTTACTDEAKIQARPARALFCTRQSCRPMA